jgi:hypothetical protein
MTTAGELMAAGIPAGAATQIGFLKSTALKGTGTTKATALILTGTFNVFTTVSSNTGALLPPAVGSPPVAISNGGANPLLVYANGTDIINALSAGASFSVTNAKSCVFFPAGNQWIANLSA